MLEINKTISKTILDQSLQQPNGGKDLDPF